jgi:hypothetical protein
LRRTSQTVAAVLAAVSFAHLVNDLLQSAPSRW